MQKELDETAGYEEYFVDCDYNSRTEYDKQKNECVRFRGKKIENLLQDRNINIEDEKESTGRFIDVIIHKRTCNIDEQRWSHLFCLEIKKWNNNSRDREDKDINNLKQLTSYYGYKFGFHLIFGNNKNETKIKIFKGGELIISGKIF